VAGVWGYQGRALCIYIYGEAISILFEMFEYFIYVKKSLFAVKLQKFILVVNSSIFSI